MSLLLEARKKAQSAEANHAAAVDELHAENQPATATDEIRQSAREAGQNLFSAKSPSVEHTSRVLLYALGGTILLLAVGAGYWWSLDSAGGLSPQHPVAVTPTQPIQAATVAAEPQSAVITDAAPAADEITPEPAPPVVLPEPTPTVEPQVRQKSSVRIEPQRAEIIDPLLRDAYLAYRTGKQDEAQHLYQAMLKKDGNNADALLGLAAIAQQHGDNLVAAQYYSRVLALDPRNAVANAGMTVLNNEDDGNESRLKTLLREQGNSAALHFALGNLYAGQSRWSEAQQAYFNAWTLESDNAEFAYNLAVSLDHLGQTNLAVRYYRHAQQLDSSHSTGFDHEQVKRRIEALDTPSR